MFERTATDEVAWVFVSHSSVDLKPVRIVRNYLEEKGAAPILFHLKALERPDEFWPLIEREIQARNFFLYCDSPSARRSEWVSRERRAAASLSKEQRIKVGVVDVGRSEIDHAGLDAFLKETRVFASYAIADKAKVMPYIDALEAADFQVFDQRRDMSIGDFRRQLPAAMSQAAAGGTVVAFISTESLRSAYAQMEVKYALDQNARVMPVLLDQHLFSLHDPFARRLKLLQGLAAYANQAGAPHELVKLLLR